MDFLKMLLETKTGKMALAGIFASAAGYLGGKVDLTQFLTAIFVALQTMFIRDGIRKGQ